MPDGDNHKRLARRIRRRAQKDSVARAIAKSPVRDPDFSKRGASIIIYGWQGPDASKAGRTPGMSTSDYLRERETAVSIPGEAYDGLFNAYASGGEQAVLDYLEPFYNEQYTSYWSFGSITSFGFGEPDPSRWFG